MKVTLHKNKLMNCTLINNSLIDSAMSYKEYMELITKLYSEGKTTGDNQSEAMLGYAKMNLYRMNRLNKTIKLTEKLKTEINLVSEKMIWLVLTEGWCGDAAQNIPVFNAISDFSANIELKLILRDKNLNVMDEFLTNGGRSIPKLIAFKKEKNKIIGNWGPRPSTAQKMVNDFNKLPNGEYSDFVKRVQLWYAKDKTLELQTELVQKLNEWNSAIK